MGCVPDVAPVIFQIDLPPVPKFLSHDVLEWRDVFRDGSGGSVDAIFDGLVYATQVNSAFCAFWLVYSEVIRKVLFTSEQLKRKWPLVSVFEEEIIWINTSYLACVVYTKTIIHLHFCE